MDLLPAIDLRQGRIVRLERGSDGRRTTYEGDPVSVLREYGSRGARWVHVVDLDAAFGEDSQTGLVERLLAMEDRPRVELGGGLRSRGAVERALRLGADRVVLGSLVGRDPELFRELCRELPGRVVPALDVAEGALQTDGWREEGPPWRRVAERLRGLPCPAVLVTDVDRDGTLRGPNLELARSVSRISGIPALLSGGVRSLDDLRRAARSPEELAGVVVGKALLEGRFELEEALGALASGTGEREVGGPTRRPFGPESDLAVRVIPCLDVAESRVVKGVRFRDLEDLGDPVEAAAVYAAQGADEIVLLDVSASHEGRGTRLDWVRAVAREVFVPLTVGGGVANEEEARNLLRAGADKVAVNSAPAERPELISEMASRFGSQCVVLSVDARRRVEGDGWEVVTHGGRRRTEREAIEWIREGVDRGAGEILLTSMDGDGTQTGYDLELLRAASRTVPVPVIASGGAGRVEHLAEALEAGAAAVLAASIFHQGTMTVVAVKRGLARRGFPVRGVGP